MTCKKCGSEWLDVLDTRPAWGGIRRRRRVCAKCGERMTTYEGTKEELAAAIFKLYKKQIAGSILETIENISLEDR